MRTKNKRSITLSDSRIKVNVISILTTVLFLGALTTCSFEELVKGGSVGSEPALDPKLYIVPTMVTEHTGSRGMPIDTVAEMSDFGFFSSYTNTTIWNAGSSTCVKMFNRKMIRDAAAESATGNTLVMWKYETTPIVEWDAATAASMYSFFAYAPYETGNYNAGSNPAGNGIVVTSTASTAGRPTLSYTVPSKVENQPDLMFAEPVYNLLPTGHPVRLLMRHALTAIGFRVTGGLSEKLTGLSITGVVVAGNAETNGSNIVWNLTGGKVTTDYSTSINFDTGQSYYTVTNTMSNPMKDDGWLMMLPQVLDSDAKVKISLNDGTTREIKLKIDNTSTWEWQAGKRILYDIYLTPAGSTTVVPGNVVLPYPAQTPAAKTLSVVCLDYNGNPDPTEAWTLSVPSGVTWLRLSESSTGSPASSSVSGPGSKTVYLVADPNYGTTAVSRTVNLTLDGFTIATTITQEAFPGPGFTGWVYVKKDATGSGLSWNNALPTIGDALTTAMVLRAASFPVHGILVAGGSHRVYNGNFVTADRIFGGWEGLAGTELPNNPSAPHTSIFRDLTNYKAVVNPGTNAIQITGSDAQLDGFVVQGANINNGSPALFVSSGIIHAVEVINNTVIGTSDVVRLQSDATAVNILIANNTAGLHITNSTLVNATMVGNTGPLVAGNGAQIFNSIFWSNTFCSFSGTYVVQYSAFPTGSKPVGTGNIDIDPNNNTAWYSPTVTVPGPHFNMVDNLAKPYYSALNDRAPMLGSGDEALFNTNTLFMPSGHKKDINGNPRHVMGTDIGCYEDQELEGISIFINVAPTTLWLSPTTGNTSKAITVSSNDSWTIPTPPANASLSATSGPAGVTNVTLTRSATNFGPSSFDVKSGATGETVAVHVDNYHIVSDQFMLTNNTGLNTGTFDVYVYGGSETFTIVPGSYDSWINSATILPNGKLELTAYETLNGEPRTGYITLAHANDPTYQVIMTIIQSFEVIPPFKYLVIKYTWDTSGGSDLDIVVEFTGQAYDPPQSPPYPAFVNMPYTSGSSSHKAVGWYTQCLLEMNGSFTDYMQYNNNSTYTTAVTDNQTLMLWGGDATSAQGETVFFKAPLITPVDPMNDGQNLPRYITLDAYAGWYNGTLGSPVKLAIYTYADEYNGVPSVMVKPDYPLSNSFNPFNTPPIHYTNFYNVPEGTLPANLLTSNAWDLLNPPIFSVDRDLIVSKNGGTTNAQAFRAGYERLATITYDRYKRSAEVTWHAAEYTGSIVISKSTENTVVSNPPK